MATLTYDEIAVAAENLSEAERLTLIARLQRGLDERRRLLAEFERRKQAGDFQRATSMRGKYASPPAAALTEDQLRNALHQIGTEWEDDLEP